MHAHKTYLLGPAYYKDKKWLRKLRISLVYLWHYHNRLSHKLKYFSRYSYYYPDENYLIN